MDINPGNPRQGRAMFTPAVHDFHLTVFTLKDRFYLPVLHVFHPARQIEGYRLLPGGGSKSDSLDATGNNDMDTLHLTTPHGVIGDGFPFIHG